MRSSLICLICSLAFVKAVWAAEPQFCGEFKQGEIIRGLAAGSKEISLHGKKFPVADDGQFLVALARDEQSRIDMAFAQNVFSFDVLPTKWDIQKIEGVSQRKVMPAPEDEKEILREQKDVRAALSVVDPKRQDWRKGFILPVEGRISGHFGNQRFFNGVPKNPHSGTDIAAPEGTPVKASADGRVLLSGGDYFYGGNMVILDHGMGLQTIYMHLKKAVVQVGDNVRQGEVIGEVGSTGRATGPHLHWGASLNNVRFRPHSLLDLEQKKCKTYTEKVK